MKWRNHSTATNSLISYNEARKNKSIFLSQPEQIKDKQTSKKKDMSMTMI